MKLFLKLFLLTALVFNISCSKEEESEVNLIETEPFTINAHFNDGAIGDKADGGGDGFHGAGGKSLYTDKQFISGNGVELTIEEGITGFGTWGGEFFYPKMYKGSSIWFSVHTYFPSDFDHYSYGEGNRLKFLRISTLNEDGDNHGYNDLYIDMLGSENPYKWIYEGQQQWVNVGVANDLIVKDTWENYQMALTFDTVSKDDGGMAEIWIWKNGILLSHITNRITLVDNTDYSNRALLFTYWNGGAPKTQSMYVDDIIITNITPTTTDDNGYAIVKSSLE